MGKGKVTMMLKMIMIRIMILMDMNNSFLQLGAEALRQVAMLKAAKEAHQTGKLVILHNFY